MLAPKGRAGRLATGFVALTLPLLPAHRIISRLRRECRTPFREPLQFMDMSVRGVNGGTFPHTYRGFA
jgi:hypothetical protein